MLPPPYLFQQKKIYVGYVKNNENKKKNNKNIVDFSNESQKNIQRRTIRRNKNGKNLS